jgi:hypothetical protein
MHQQTERLTARASETRRKSIQQLQQDILQTQAVFPSSTVRTKPPPHYFSHCFSEVYSPPLQRCRTGKMDCYRLLRFGIALVGRQQSRQLRHGPSGIVRDLSERIVHWREQGLVPSCCDCVARRVRERGRGKMDFVAHIQCYFSFRFFTILLKFT